jgi:hypothetical protein
MSDRPDYCRGCGQSTRLTPLSKEDIVPKWLQPHLHLPNIKLKQTVMRESRRDVIREFPLESFLYRGAVCKSCNSGWMSRLEGEAKSILLPLIEASRVVSSLSDPERMTVARWAFKTGFMILGTQTSYLPPWSFFEQWALTGAKHPVPAYILGLSNPGIATGFGFTVREDIWSDDRRANIRVGIGIRALHLVVVLPATGTQHAVEVANNGFELLFPRVKLFYRPEPTTKAALDYQSYLDALTNQVKCGRREDDFE